MHIIIQNLPKAYEVFLYTFHSTKTMLGIKSVGTFGDDFYNLLVIEHEELVPMKKIGSKIYVYLAKGEPKKHNGIKDPKLKYLEAY